MEGVVGESETKMSKTGKVVFGDVELEPPLLIDDKRLKILVINNTVKDVSMTNTELARVLCLRHVVERIKEIHIYVKRKEGENQK